MHSNFGLLPSDWKDICAYAKLNVILPLLPISNLLRFYFRNSSCCVYDTAHGVLSNASGLAGVLDSDPSGPLPLGNLLVPSHFRGPCGKHHTEHHKLS